MSNNEKKEKKEDVFQETFGGLLDSNKKEPDAVVHQPENKLEDVLLGKKRTKHFLMKKRRKQQRIRFLLQLGMNSGSNL